MKVVIDEKTGNVRMSMDETDPIFTTQEEADAYVVEAAKKYIAEVKALNTKEKEH